MVNYRAFDDASVIRVCQEFLDGKNVQQIADDLNARKPREQIGREGVYPLMREARRRGFLTLVPPRYHRLQERIRDRFEIDDRHLTVLRGDGVAGAEYVAAEAARTILELIREVATRKDFENDERVRIGLGGGGTVMRVARELARLIADEQSPPPLGLHALSSGFDVLKPQTAPVLFFGFFDQVAPDIEYVGLFAPAAAHPAELSRLRERTNIGESIDRASAIDIVITSLASAHDEHGELNHYLDVRGRGGGIGELRRKGWVGDVTYRPYSETGPIEAGKAIQSMSIFDLKDLVSIANSGDRYVVLVATPCNACHETKGAALRPLLQEKKLQLWTHLLMDMDTAESVLPPSR